MHTVESLRKSGWKVSVYHKRRTNPKMVHPLRPKGGRTTVTVTHPETGESAQGVAYCSKEDFYCNKVGVAIALKRALENLSSGNLINLKKEVDISQDRVIIRRGSSKGIDLEVGSHTYHFDDVHTRALYNFLSDIYKDEASGSTSDLTLDSLSRIFAKSIRDIWG